jgi:hypothetical protein
MEDRRRLTRFQIRRDNVEHIGVHVSVYDPITGCIIAGSNEDRVSLSNGDTYQVYRRRLDVSLHRGEKNRKNQLQKKEG